MYRLGIWFIALTLVFNGVASYAMDEDLGVTMAVTQLHHDDSASLDCNAHSHETMAGVTQCNSGHHDAHDHFKCCGVCNVAGLIPRVDIIPATFSYADISFWVIPHKLVGHLVPLDPHIPILAL